ncbi:MAG TPA: MFS transporter [Micromonosporaceae bacterium]|nr:MFS transporter [Micromonosporaceae bacterium]HCU49618.1 MFS transporter [Micromonosporaceae bacterium]
MCLSRNRNFSIFWFVQTLSVAGDSFSFVAIPLLVLHVTGSVAQMGLLTGVAGAAAIVTGFFAGAIADRLDRRLLLIVCDLARAALYALIPFAWLFGPQVWLLYVVVPVTAAFGMIFQVTYVTAVPNLVPAGQITEANGKLYASFSAAAIVGPLLAGVVSAALGPVAAIGIDAISFGVSAIGLWFVRLRRQAAPSTVDKINPWRDFLAGLRFLLAHPVLRALTVMLSFLLFLSVGLTDIFIYYLKSGLGQTDSTVGYVLAVAAVGTVIAAMIVAPARRSLGFGVCWISAHALSGVAIACIGLSTKVPIVATLITVIMFCFAVAGICSMSLRQEITPDHLLGRVTATFWTIQRAVTPLGAALITAATARFGVTQVCLVVGSATLLIALTGVLTPIRQARPEQLGIETA